MTATLPPEDDFDDLDAEIALAIAAKEERKSLTIKQKRLAVLSRSTHPDAELERQILTAIIRRMEEGIVWHTVAATALFHTQTCMTCGARHGLFMGWMSEQHHKTDPSARRLLKGKPIEPLPERIEEHDQGFCEMCSDCAECCLIINQATGGQHENG